MSDYSGEKYVDIVFDGPPSPDGPVFVEVEGMSGQSINFGEWVERPDGLWAIRVVESDFTGNQYWCSECDLPRPRFRLLAQLREHVEAEHPGFEVRRPSPIIGGWG